MACPWTGSDSGGWGASSQHPCCFGPACSTHTHTKTAHPPFSTCPPFRLESGRGLKGAPSATLATLGLEDGDHLQVGRVIPRVSTLKVGAWSPVPVSSRTQVGISMMQIIASANSVYDIPWPTSLMS